MAAESTSSWAAWVLAAGALYAFGHVAGALLVPPDNDRPAVSAAVIRLTAGLLLSTIAFFLALVLSLPWFIGPAAVLSAALGVYRRRALAVAPPRITITAPGVAAAVLAAVLVSPIVLSAARMAPGPFAPVFYNVDSAYFLEQVQSLARTATYPPESLSNAGGRRAYHFATHGMAALISRTSGLPPHQAVWAVVLPLLVAGILGAATIVAAHVAPSLSAAVAVPFLLLSVPSFWYPFWTTLAPALVAAAAEPAATATAIAESYELWGVASNVGQNVGAEFLTLASLGAVLTAPAAGWRLPIFLIGTGILVKVSAGVALLGGFTLASLYQSLRGRSLRPLRPAVAAVVLSAATFGAFWLLPRLPPEFAVEPFALFHLQRMEERGRLLGTAADTVWLLLPALLVALTRVRDPDARSAPLFLAALAPLLIVNVSRSIDARPGGGGATDDWLQILSPVPFLAHAFVLSVAGARWRRLGVGARAGFMALLAASVVPPLWVAARYSRVLIASPQDGHEYADNHLIAQALAAIPLDGLIVTNDLRYPAQRFSRDNRQMQIPALFGHQAFAVNYAYEVFAFSRERLALQPLLQSNDWPAIVEAARTHGWTHFLVHKDYAHPAVPLEHVFENAAYAVYRFR